MTTDPTLPPHPESRQQGSARDRQILGLSTDELAGLSVDELTGNKTAITMVMHYYEERKIGTGWFSNGSASGM
jgi:hypothetical protein